MFNSHTFRLEFVLCTINAYRKGSTKLPGAYLFIAILEGDIIERGFIREVALLPTKGKNFIEIVFCIPSVLSPFKNRC